MNERLTSSCELNTLIKQILFACHAMGPWEEKLWKCINYYSLDWSTYDGWDIMGECMRRDGQKDDTINRKEGYKEKVNLKKREADGYMGCNNSKIYVIMFALA